MIACKVMRTVQSDKKMKRIFLVLIVLFTGSCASYKPNFNIVFGSGFKNNSVDLSINDVKIISNITMSSDTVTGTVWNSYIIYENDSLRLLGQSNKSNKSNKIERQILMPSNRLLNFIIQIDGKPYYLQADLKKGNNIFIDKHLFYYNVNLRQFKKKAKIY